MTKIYLNELYDNLSYKLANASLKDSKIMSFDRDHIFFEILEHLSKDISSEEKVSMFYLFNSYQKALEEARYGNSSSAQYCIQYINSLHFEFSADVKKGMDSLYFPVEAFVQYMNKKHDDAIRSLETSIKLLDNLEKNGIEGMLSAKTEQILNIGRVLLSQGNFEEMNIIISDLILFLAYGKPCNFLDAYSKEVLEKETLQERLATIDYVLSSILGKILHSNSSTSEEKRKKIRNLFLMLWDYNQTTPSAITGFDNAIDLIKHLMNDDHSEFLIHFDTFRKNLDYIPKQIQYVILEGFKEIYSQYGNDNNLESILTNYYKNILKINPHILEPVISGASVKSVIK